MKTLATFGAVFLGVIAGGILCVWLLVSSCESTAHRSFDGVTQTLKFPTATPTPSHPISDD